MRKIKFRAWDKKYKEMIPDIWIAPQYDWLVLSDNDALAERDNRGRKNGEEYVLMEFVGLKDKNGKEIYEGDVVRCANSSMPLLYIRWKDGDSGFCASDATKWFNFMLDGSFALGVEVIGNIYENPELLSN